MNSILINEFPYKFFSKSFFTLTGVERILAEAYYDSHKNFMVPTAATSSKIAHDHLPLIQLISYANVYFDGGAFQTSLFVNGYWMDRNTVDAFDEILDKNNGRFEKDDIKLLGHVHEKVMLESGDTFSIDQDFLNMFIEDLEYFLDKYRMLHIKGDVSPEMVNHLEGAKITDVWKQIVHMSEKRVW